MIDHLSLSWLVSKGHDREEPMSLFTRLGYASLCKAELNLDLVVFNEHKIKSLVNILISKYTHMNIFLNFIG